MYIKGNEEKNKMKIRILYSILKADAQKFSNFHLNNTKKNLNFLALKRYYQFEIKHFFTKK